MSELLTVIQEKTTCWVGASFTDEDGNPVVPASISYSIRDVGSGTVIKASTPVAVPAAEIEIVVSGAENAIVNSHLPHETHALTLEWTYGAGGAYGGKAEYRWRVKNLGGVS